ncbi:MAG: DUF4397 domain-containing protein [Pedobacter sp.]|nr:MAG: DUF4397 domain-containing protein [Pedobacter sp.]
MKYSKKTLQILSIITLGLSISSCKKDFGEVPPVSAISFVNAAVGSPAVNVYLGGNMVNNNLFTYGKDLNYVNAYSGTRDVSFYENGEKKISGSVDLADGRFYSLFLAGKWPQADLVLLKDSLTRPATGKTHIRFANLSKDAGSLDFGLTNGKTLASEKAYKIASDYMAIEGNTAYTFVIRNHGTPTDTVSIPAVTLETGRSYTIWAKGLKAETGANALGLAVIRNY